MGNEVEIVKALISPTEKLINAVQGAIGRAYEPRHTRKMAEAKAYEIATIGQAMRELSDIPIIYDKGAVEMDTADFDDFVKRTQSRLAYQELTKQNNIETVIDKAYDILNKEETVSSEPVDADWMLRFFNSVQDVSSTQMQELWSKILAGEIRKPTTYSFRTLETLRNISTEEAKLFQKLCAFKITCDGCIFIPNKYKLLKAYDISSYNILKLGECGLISTRALLSLDKFISTEKSVIIKSVDNIVTAKSLNKETILSLKIIPFTEVGVELSNVFNQNINENFIIDYARIIKDKNPTLEVSAYKIVKTYEDSIKYEKKDLL